MSRHATPGAAIPTHISRVAIWETNVCGAVAHHAVCMVSGCDWKTERYDARTDGQPHGNVVRVAKAHGARHTAAQEHLDEHGKGKR